MNPGEITLEKFNGKILKSNTSISTILNKSIYLLKRYCMLLQIIFTIPIYYDSNLINLIYYK